MSPAASSSLRRLAAIFSGIVEWAASAIRSGTADRSFAIEPAALAAMRIAVHRFGSAGLVKNGGQFRGQSVDSHYRRLKTNKFGENVAVEI